MWSFKPHVLQKALGSTGQYSNHKCLPNCFVLVEVPGHGQRECPGIDPFVSLGILNPKLVWQCTHALDKGSSRNTGKLSWVPGHQWI